MRCAVPHMSLGLILSHALVSELVELSVKGHLVVLEKKDWGGLGKDAGGGGEGRTHLLLTLAI